MAIDFTDHSTLKVWQHENEFLDTFIVKTEIEIPKITEEGTEVCSTWNVWQYYENCKSIIREFIDPFQYIRY